MIIKAEKSHHLQDEHQGKMVVCFHLKLKEQKIRRASGGITSLTLTTSNFECQYSKQECKFALHLHF
jgi:hypothetical protein